MGQNSIIITKANPKSPISEAYRTLRTNIQYSNIDMQQKTFVVTSSSPMEGKTTLIGNLAVTFAQTGNKVLLIDADLRKPMIHNIFGVRNERGLTDLLVSHEEYNKYVLKSEIPNLDILTSGIIPPNPSELLESNTMRQFIQKASADYDKVFLDAPPVGFVTDAAIISTYVDGTILVANTGHVKIDDMKRAKELLNKVNARIVGVVLNKMKGKIGKYKYNHYFDYDKK